MTNKYVWFKNKCLIQERCLVQKKCLVQFHAFHWGSSDYIYWLYVLNDTNTLFVQIRVISLLNSTLLIVVQTFFSSFFCNYEKRPYEDSKSLASELQYNIEYICP